MEAIELNKGNKMQESREIFLESVNHDLKSVVQMAEVDFVAVNDFLVRFCKKSQGVHTTMATKIEAMMCGLQYMDVLKQRMDHLILTHQKMLTTPLAINFEGSFFHLHVFQSLTVELDLLRSIKSIKSLLCDLNDWAHGNGVQTLSNEEYFSRTSRIKNILRKTMNALILEGGDTRHLPIPALTPEQIGLLNSLYTMESERVVLEWFLKSMPSGTWEELLEFYEDGFNQINSNTIELF